MKERFLPLLACALTLLASRPAPAAALVPGLFIASPDAQATYASAPDLLAGLPGWVEQGIRTEQIGGDAGPAAIWTAAGFGSSDDKAWYPDAGDDGYTRITRTLGQDFGSVGLFAGIGWLDDEGPSVTAYELLHDGAVVLAGTLAAPFGGAVFGFTGGDFDEIRLRANRGPLDSFGSCLNVPSFRCNYLWVDFVRLSDDPMRVPAPPSMALALLALGLLARQRSNRLRAASSNAEGPSAWPIRSSSPSMATPPANCCPPWPTATGS